MKQFHSEQKRVGSKSRFFYFRLLFMFILLFLNIEKGIGQLVVEPFNYVVHVSDGLAKQSSSVWSPLNTGDSILLTSGSLNYSGLPTPTGNKIAFDGAGTDYYRSFTSQSTTGTTVYLSFLLNISSLGSLNTTGTYFTGVGQTTSIFGATIHLRKSTIDATKFNIGIQVNTSSTISWISTDYSVGTTYFIVSAYQIVSGITNDIAKLWINPSLGQSTEPSATATANYTSGTDLTSVSQVFLRQQASTTTPFVEMDEIRIATSWAQATPSALSAPTITTPTSANITSSAADLGGNVTSDGGSAVTERGVVWSATATNNDPLIGGSGVTKVTGTGTTGVFTVNATSLPSATGISYKAYATNSIGTSYTSVSTFNTLGATPPLPVAMVSFSGMRVASRNILKWTTGNEQNNTGFEVLRAIDGIHFSSIGFVGTLALNGNSNDLLHYTFIDDMPAGDKQYYQLRQVDIDGRSKTSTVVLIRGSNPGTITIDQLIPNPAKEKVKVILLSPGKDKIQMVITDLAGKMISQQINNVEAGSNTISVQTGGMATGTYLIQVISVSNGQRSVSKLIKQ